ncbi:hypothetical protein [Anaerotruncus sp.]|jgi:hypothetical protein|uniref:hypothetical protein n=1 Tax=Anaerotruncus TaxID=244127 RepID=UPI002174355A|nr:MULTISPECIES: hypothetical protein [Anaerotruncus]MCI8493282.1 hypothetical protein [Anaerotruncus sp.]
MTDILQELYSEHPKSPEQLALQAAEQAFWEAFGYMPLYSPDMSFITEDITRQLWEAVTKKEPGRFSQ